MKIQRRDPTLSQHRKKVLWPLGYRVRRKLVHCLLCFMSLKVFTEMKGPLTLVESFMHFVYNSVGFIEGFCVTYLQ